MLEHQQASTEEPQRHTTAAPLTPSAAAILPSQAAVLVAAYVAQVETERQEPTRARLAELIAVYQELDATPEAAAHSAIQQMENERLAAEKGQAAAQQNAQKQARTLAHSCSQSRSARPATLIALKWFGGAALATTALCTLIGPTTNLFLYLVLMFTMFGLPMVMGAGVGMRAEKRPALGSFYALALLFPLKMLLDLLTMHSAGYEWDGLLWMAVDFALFWIPLGCLAASLTGLGRDRLRRKRRRDAVKGTGGELLSPL